MDKCFCGSFAAQRRPTCLRKHHIAPRYLTKILWRDIMAAMSRNSFPEICNILSTIDDKAIIADFFESILTPKELEDISSRWEVVKLLDQGMSQRKIAKKLGLSLCKITRGSKELKKENSAFKKVLEEYYKQEIDRDD